MSPSHRLMILLLPLISMPLHGCSCGHNRQIVYPGRPGGPVRVDTSKGVHVRAPFVDVHVPAGEPNLDLDDRDD
jgi:hypothetical protein